MCRPRLVETHANCRCLLPPRIEHCQPGCLGFCRVPIIGRLTEEACQLPNLPSMVHQASKNVKQRHELLALCRRLRQQHATRHLTRSDVRRCGYQVVLENEVYELTRSIPTQQGIDILQRDPPNDQWIAMYQVSTSGLEYMEKCQQVSDPASVGSRNLYCQQMLL